MKFIQTMTLLLFITLLFAFTGCSTNEAGSENSSDMEVGGKEKESEESREQISGGVLNIAINVQPPNLDPPTTAATATRDTSRLIYETLLTTDSSYGVIPMLAESFDTEDNKTFVFHLREGIMFHNGKEMIAEDVIASMERWLEKSPITGSIFEGATWEAQDDYTVVLELKESSALALDTMATSKQYAAVMPKEVIEAAPEEGVEEYIGTGPYKFVDWKQDQYLHFDRYEDYQLVEMEADGLAGKKEALIDEIYFHFITDASTRVAGLQTGEYDFVYSIPYDNYEQINGDSNLETHLMQSGVMVLHYNKGGGPASDVAVRKAINTGIDVDALMMASFPNKDFYTLHSSYMDEQIANWSSQEGNEHYNINDPEKAKEMLAESSYNGEEFKILATRDYNHHYNMGVVLHEQLTNLGINATLEVYDWPTTTDLIHEEGTFDIFVISFATVSTPPQFLSLSPTWAGGIQDQKVIDGMVALETALTIEEATSNWNDLQGYMWEEHMPISVVGSYSDIFGFNNKVEGVTTFLGPIFWNASIVE